MCSKYVCWNIKKQPNMQIHVIKILNKRKFLPLSNHIFGNTIAWNHNLSLIQKWNTINNGDLLQIVKTHWSEQLFSIPTYWINHYCIHNPWHVFLVNDQKKLFDKQNTISRMNKNFTWLYIDELVK